MTSTDLQETRSCACISIYVEIMACRKSCRADYICVKYCIGDPESAKIALRLILIKAMHNG